MEEQDIFEDEETGIKELNLKNIYENYSFPPLVGKSIFVYLINEMYDADFILDLDESYYKYLTKYKEYDEDNEDEENDDIIRYLDMKFVFKSKRLPGVFTFEFHKWLDTEGINLDAFYKLDDNLGKYLHLTIDSGLGYEFEDLYKSIMHNEAKDKIIEHYCSHNKINFSGLLAVMYLYKIMLDNCAHTPAYDMFVD